MASPVPSSWGNWGEGRGAVHQAASPAVKRGLARSFWRSPRSRILEAGATWRWPSWHSSGCPWTSALASPTSESELGKIPTPLALGFTSAWRGSMALLGDGAVVLPREGEAGEDLDLSLS